MYRLKWLHYLMYFSLMFFVYGFLILLIKAERVTVFDKELPSTLNIVWHNLSLFVQWQVAFILTPIYWLFETLILSFMLKSGIVTYGLNQAVDKLWRHGLIELPNVFLYQLLSFRLLYFWWQSKKIKTIVDYVLENKYFYLLSIGLICLAGFIEGVRW